MQVKCTNFMCSERSERPIQGLSDPLLREIAVLTGIYSVGNMRDEPKRPRIDGETDFVSITMSSPRSIWPKNYIEEMN